MKPRAAIPVVTAGFWQRAAAWSLDAMPLAAITLLLCWSSLAAATGLIQQSMDLLLPAVASMMSTALLSASTDPLQLLQAVTGNPQLVLASAGLESAIWAMTGPPALVFALVGALYHVGFEASVWQASPGKRLLGLEVVDRTGKSLGIIDALARHLAAGLSWLTLNLGHALAAFSPHLALHDRLTGTRVATHSGERRLPDWARAWLGLLGIAQLAATVWCAVRFGSAWQASIDAALRQALG